MQVTILKAVLVVLLIVADAGAVTMFRVVAVSAEFADTGHRGQRRALKCIAVLFAANALALGFFLFTAIHV